jgi:hypothetical protein
VALGSGKSGAGKKSAREARDRARLYQARQEFHDGVQRRRTRDNIIAGVVGGVLILGVVGGQIAYYTVGPGQPAPAPTTTPAPTVSPTSPPTPTPTDSPSPSDPPGARALRRPPPR